MKSAKIKGVAMLRVDTYGVTLNNKDIRDLLRDALNPSEDELKRVDVPAHVSIEIEPIPTELTIE